MIYFKHIQRGVLHKTFCEDFLIDEIINQNYRILGVFDGCSSGFDSHFASALIGKTIGSIAYHTNTNSKKDILKEIMYQTIISLKKTQKELDLDVFDLLSTIILMLVNTKTETADIIAIGDGLVSINKKVTKIDQNNAPQYLAYFLEEINNYKEFEKFYKEQLIFKDIKIEDVTISTDGIDTLFHEETNTLAEIDFVEYLAEDLYLRESSAMLSRKCNIIKKKYGLTIADDLAIIRVLKN